MKRQIILLSLLSLVLCLPVMAQKESFDVRHGNKEYRKENYSAAETDYRKGLNKNEDSYSARYNLGNSLFKQEKYKDALSEYIKADSILTNSKDYKRKPEKYAQRKAEVAHNVGNSLYAMGDYGNAAEAYKESLRNNPKDDETRYNLVKSLQMLQMQQQQ
ncbi:MAG: tetratricopeptide repeat protein, partial [Paludibacteraceae bacterium]|nr:tetratricopeptide repeat protein [Paludibacteraceae bacterium]